MLNVENRAQTMTYSLNIPSTRNNILSLYNFFTRFQVSFVKTFNDLNNKKSSNLLRDILVAGWKSLF